jgi:hypothetical protein
MDPYLEHPVLWPGIHHGLIHNLATQLQPLIEPRYVARVEQRVYFEGPDRQVIPDLQVHPLRPGGGPAVAERATDAPLVLEVNELEVQETYIEIVDLYANQKLVALIEVVSPTNKRPGPGRRSYRRKQRQTLARDCHLIEIDLLRQGRPVVSAPQRRLREQFPHDYLVCVNRWPKRHLFELYPRRLRERLPRVRLPLARPDPDVPMDVQAALEQVYWEGRYMRTVRYDQPCEPPLAAADQQWANECWAAYRAAHPEFFPPPAP